LTTFNVSLCGDATCSHVASFYWCISLFYAAVLQHWRTTKQRQHNALHWTWWSVTGTQACYWQLFMAIRLPGPQGTRYYRHLKLWRRTR